MVADGLELLQVLVYKNYNVIFATLQRQYTTSFTRKKIGKITITIFHKNVY